MFKSIDDSSITDFSFAQIFFVVGHLSIKMLIYFEQFEDTVKRIVGGSRNDEVTAANEMELICGGKEAEIDEEL